MESTVALGDDRLADRCYVSSHAWQAGGRILVSLERLLCAKKAPGHLARTCVQQAFV